MAEIARSVTPASDQYLYTMQRWEIAHEAEATCLAYESSPRQTLGAALSAELNLTLLDISVILSHSR